MRGFNLRTILSCITVLLSVLTASCGGGGGDDVPPIGGATCGGPNLPPCPVPALSVSLLDPSDRSVHGVPHLQAFASTPGERVDFLVDGASIGSTTAGAVQPGAGGRIYSLAWDTANFSDGVHTVIARAFDGQGRSAESNAAAVLVANTVTIPIVLSAGEVLPPSSSSNSTGSGQVVVNLYSGAISGGFTLAGITTVDSAHVHRGYAGTSGAIALTLIRNGLDPNRWDIPVGSTLAAADIEQLWVGGLYMDAHSSTLMHPQGSLRAQIKPKNISVAFASMTGADVVPAVNTNLSGVAALTINARRFTLNANAFDATGLVAGTTASVNYGFTGANGSVAISLRQVGTTWSVEETLLSPSQIESLAAGGLYVAIGTAAHPNGEIRGRLSGSTGVKLSELQAAIFTPRCAGCHDGASDTLPGSMDLRAGRSYASLRDVASTQQPGLRRAAASAPGLSYLVHKVEGIATITGDRMPASGPPLTRDEIDAIRSWIRGGAHDDGEAQLAVVGRRL